ncbi:uncharacterized protein LOC141663562 isoform X1 [Apium graveolens]|uniref:uncharacterized protein LOC141663562 isoform X1 n=1 Tax=Apium graveolens TaxID=4045 RepID=UPI003D79A322
MTRFLRLNFRGSKDGDVCVVEVKKMKICHWSKRLHSGSSIASLEFCPNERRQGTFTDSKDQLYNAATEGTETILNQLLMELNGFDTGNGVIILGATNRKDLLDPALLQPGHFDRKVYLFSVFSWMDQLAWVLKKIAEANPGITINLEDFCTTSDDDNLTPVTGGTDL